MVAIRLSRGKDVLREFFGLDINGAGVVDGWRAYNIIPVIQRCWVHLIRKIDAFVEQPGVRSCQKPFIKIQGAKRVPR